MINLYQVLKLSPHANANEIQTALKRQQGELDARTIKAVNEWLLVPDVRVKYDAKLRQEMPDFFMNTSPIQQDVPKKNKPKIVPLTDETADDDDYMDVPPLWNPSAAANWCLLCSGIFGATLHALNWKALGEEKLAMQNWIWAGVQTLGFGLYILNMINAGWMLLLLIAWYFASARKQIRFFKEEFGSDYERRGWVVPILCALGGSFVFGFVVGFLGVFLGIVSLDAL